MIGLFWMFIEVTLPIVVGVLTSFTADRLGASHEWGICLSLGACMAVTRLLLGAQP